MTGSGAARRADRGDAPRTRLPALGPHGEGWVAIQVVLLALVAISGLAGPVWDGPVSVASAAAGVGLIAAGGVLAARGVLDLRAYFTTMPRPVDGSQLVRHGAYALVRHPMYGGLILGAVGWALLRASALGLVAAAVLAIFFRLKSAREEAWLSEAFADYPAYRRTTRRFVPWLY